MTREDGSSLVEVLVAFAILAVVVIMGLKLFSDGLGRIEAADQRADALALAQAKLNEIAADPTMGPFTGTTESGLAWSVTLSDAYAGERAAWTALRPMQAEVRVARGLLSADEPPLLATVILMPAAP